MNWRLTQRGALRRLGMLSLVALMTLTGCGVQLKGTGSNILSCLGGCPAEPSIKYKAIDLLLQRKNQSNKHSKMSPKMTKIVIKVA